MFCPKCLLYTMKTACPKCNTVTYDRKPPKYSPDDKYGKYRRMAKIIAREERSGGEVHGQ